MIRIQHVTRTFGRFAAVNDACLHIRPGESVALWGANGAGKTTLIRCVLGLYRFSGSISVAGFDVRSDGKRARAQIGYVPQELGFYDDLRVEHAVRWFARLKAVPGVRVSDQLAHVGLTGHEHKRIRELSGGMKQRLALALALLGDPSILVLDEVTASLDALGREEFVGALSRLARDGRSMLFASHRTDEVASLADRVVVMEQGRIVSTGSSAEFAQRANPASTLKLRMDRQTAALAVASLRERGFDARLNCVGLLVSVEAGRRAAPLQALAEAKIPFADFELLGPADRACCREVHHD